MKKQFMRKALELARLGEGSVNPNPLVGAVIVREDRIIGKGYHERFGGPHAEINAINSVKTNLEGSTLYVNLEPCSHTGKTPPCTEAIIKNGIKKVIIGMEDPNPLVSGKGISKLKNAGIEVETGILESECRKLNEIFQKYITTGLPYLIMKSAMSLDGKIATKTGDSRWISCEESRLFSHTLRNRVSAIMVGIGTVLSDDPELTCRIRDGKNPVRVIMDSFLKIPLNAKVLEDTDRNPTLIVTTDPSGSESSSSEKRSIMKKLEKQGARIMLTDPLGGRANLRTVLKNLGKRKIDSVLLEGGGTLNYSALNERVVDKVHFFIAPRIIGGKNAVTPVEGAGVEKIAETLLLNNLESSRIGDDILLTGYPENGGR